MPRALVIGGSIGGLFAANLLRTIGWDVLVFERSSGDLSARGAAIGTTEPLFAVMRRIGVALDALIGVQMRWRTCLDRAGAVAFEVRSVEITTGWNRIYRPLRQALPDHCLRTGAALTRFHQDESGVTAYFSDGTSARGDLLVGADGVRSIVRRQLMPDVVCEYAGYVSWRGVADESALPAAVNSVLADRVVHCFAAGGQAMCIPMPGPRDETGTGSRRYGFVCHCAVDADESLRQLFTDAAGRRHDSAIAPALIRPQVIAELKAKAQELFAPQIREVVRRIDQLLLQPIFDLESPRMVVGRVALLGDAAFTARPHVAAGVTKAALDAACLADALATFGGSLDAALCRYEAERRAFGKALVARGRSLGAHLGRPGPGVCKAAPQRAYREWVVRESGSAATLEALATELRP